MRLPQRVVVDHDVDRREVQGPRGSQPTRTNSPKSSVWREVESCCDLSSDIRGGFSRGVPPLPIPNRAVKPARADGTDTPVGRVGRRRTSGSPGRLMMSGAPFFVCTGHALAAPAGTPSASPAARPLCQCGGFLRVSPLRLCAVPVLIGCMKIMYLMTLQ